MNNLEQELLTSASTIRLQSVAIASLKLDKALLHNEFAEMKLDHCARELEVKQWESRTGLDMSLVLKGKYGQAWGIYSDRDVS